MNIMLRNLTILCIQMYISNEGCYILPFVFFWWSKEHLKPLRGNNHLYRMNLMASRPNKLNFSWNSLGRTVSAFDIFIEAQIREISHSIKIKISSMDFSLNSITKSKCQDLHNISLWQYFWLFFYQWKLIKNTLLENKLLSSNLPLPNP